MEYDDAEIVMTNFSCTFLLDVIVVAAAAATAIASEFVSYD
jgi:hypothetical protein